MRSGEPVLRASEWSHSHRCSVLDVVLLSQLFTGEATVLLPESLTLPTGFLGIKETAPGEETPHKFLFNNRKCQMAHVARVLSETDLKTALKGKGKNH